LLKNGRPAAPLHDLFHRVVRAAHVKRFDVQASAHLPQLSHFVRSTVTSVISSSLVSDFFFWRVKWRRADRRSAVSAFLDADAFDLHPVEFRVKLLDSGLWHHRQRAGSPS
jgi:hypothetical protein